MTTKRKTADKQRKNTGDGRKRGLANLKPWPKGQSGNPAGRPKTRTLSEAYRKWLTEPMADGTGRTYADAVAEMLCAEAAKGNVTAARELADRTEGKPRQMLDVDMNLLDWRELANKHGLNLQDVLNEARHIIESASVAGGSEFDHEDTAD